MNIQRQQFWHPTAKHLPNTIGLRPVLVGILPTTLTPPSNRLCAQNPPPKGISFPAQNDRGASGDTNSCGRAAAELAGSSTAPGAPETNPTHEQVTGWDDPLAPAGRRLDPVPLEDLGSISEQLIQEGLQEVEHDIRVAAEHEN